MITFDNDAVFAAALVINSDATMATAVQYLQANDFGNAGASVAFDNGLDTYLYTQGDNAGTDNLDVLVQLISVQGTNLITVKATTEDGLFII